MTVYLVLAAVLALCLLFVVWSWRAHARRAAEREHDAWKRRSADELAAHAKHLIRYERWEHFTAAQALLSRDTVWTDRELRSTLTQLHEEVLQEDAAQGRQGRESSSFEWHDAGFSRMCEVLDERAA